MTKTEHEVIKNVAARLRADDGKTSPEIKAVLHSRDFKLWLDTWVIAPLEYISPAEGETRDPDLALSLSR